MRLLLLLLLLLLDAEWAAACLARDWQVAILIRLVLLQQLPHNLQRLLLRERPAHRLEIACNRLGVRHVQLQAGVALFLRVLVALLVLLLLLLLLILILELTRPGRAAPKRAA